MLRMYDAWSDEENIESLLNDEGMHIEKVNNYITDKGFAGTHIDYRTPRNSFERERSPYRQRVEVFQMAGSSNEELDAILDDPNNRIIERIEKMTEVGPLVLIYYEFKPQERS